MVSTDLTLEYSKRVGPHTGKTIVPILVLTLGTQNITR